VFVTLVAQHAKSRTGLSSVACLHLLYSSTLCHKRPDFRDKVIEPNMCVLNISTTFARNVFILRRIEGDIIINYIGLHVKYTLFLSNFH